MKICLSIAGNSAEQFLFEHTGPVIRIGRDESCELCLKDAFAKSVSRNHARIDIRSTGATITDAGSSNGTLLNGKPLRDSSPLVAGDIIQMGYTGAILT